LARKMKTAAVVFCLAFALFLTLCLLGDSKVWLTPAVTSATFAYHFVMRLAVGNVYNILLHNRVNYRRWWFRPRFFEKKLYRLLGVKGWKNRLPTYDPDTFSAQLHSWDEIAQATCQSELVHETIMVLSFVPLLAIGPLGSAGVFIITSSAAALFDSLFVMTQRFNRFRLVRLLEKADRKG